MAKFDPFVVIAASIKINVKLRLQPSKIGIGNVTIQQSVNQLRAFAKTSSSQDREVTSLSFRSRRWHVAGVWLQRSGSHHIASGC